MHLELRSTWIYALLPAVAAVAVAGFVTFRLLSADSAIPEVSVTDSQPEQRADTSSGAWSETNLSELFPAANFAPVPTEAQLVSGSQIVVIGRITGVIGEERIPRSGQELVTPVGDEPLGGLRTTKYELTVETHIKGKSASDSAGTLVVQVLSGYTPPLPLNQTILAFLVPFKEGTFQASALTILREEAGVVVDAHGGRIGPASGLTLKGYAERVSNLVAEQAGKAPEAPLAVPLVLPGETITPAHFLGLQNTKAIQVTEVGKAGRSLDASDIATVIEITSQPMLIEAATAPASARTARITITLDDGHVWEFAYAPSTGQLVYEPANLQVTLPAPMREIASSALAAQ